MFKDEKKDEKHAVYSSLSTTSEIASAGTNESLFLCKEDPQHHLKQSLLASSLSLENARIAYDLAKQASPLKEKLRLLKIAFTHRLFFTNPIKIEAISLIAQTWPSAYQEEFYIFLKDKSPHCADLFKQELGKNKKEECTQEIN